MAGVIHAMRPYRETAGMCFAAEHEYEHLGETAGIADHDHDLIAELNRRLDSLWRHDQDIAHAEWHGELRQLWQETKAQDHQSCAATYCRGSAQQLLSLDFVMGVRPPGARPRFRPWEAGVL